ncbi:MAG: nuclear transport factor 2 family protein [Candidatus Omnitrophica bacterium]|nr:nuclear transport factor 2 family protein [Candidatus Omnitrophota bacterium]
MKIPPSPTKKEIAESFSNGKFELIFPYLSEKIIWIVVGENVFKGKDSVIANCKQTAEYFNSVHTVFNTDEIIETNDRVVIRGTAEFKRDGRRDSFISACDVYEFNDKNELEIISSYCIPDKK